MSEKIKVFTVGQKYWYVSRQRCVCGGKYEVTMQVLCISESGEPYDVLKTTCMNCGEEKDFTFVSDEEFREATIENEISFKQVLEYIHHLGRNKEFMALEYLEYWIRRDKEENQGKVL